MNRLPFSIILMLILPSTWGQLTPLEHERLIGKVRSLARERIGYRKSWRPGFSGVGNESWVMDCSNTARYIYKDVLDMQLPRTASDQYIHLRERNCVWPAPLGSDGRVDAERLFSQLRSGDLLFWEWTYDIQRKPPISHVMIYLGRTASGQARMAGSSTGGVGEIAGKGGVDVYPFDPNAPMGGVRGFGGGWKHKGKFVAFGRPLIRGENLLRAQPPIAAAQAGQGPRS
jgi:cell wall-associated NlpC family hydrolase